MAGNFRARLPLLWHLFPFRMEKPVVPALPRFEPQSGPELGFRSKFVLAKIGYDLRSAYERLINEPLPDLIERALERLDGGTPKVEQLSEHRLR